MKNVKTALIIPTLNAEGHISSLLASLNKQNLQPDIFLIIDSGSTDNTVKLFKSAGARVEVIEPSKFNHGGTRRFASELINAEICIFMTQDAILEHENTLENLCGIFSKNGNVGATYARQIPHDKTGVLGSHARYFNYPDTSRLKTIQDANELGVKTCFCSDSCAAYRFSALQKIGGIPTDVIGSEDVYISAKMLMAGYSVYYNADAVVRHSHDYTILEEFKRYFDIGVFYGRNDWIKSEFGSANKEGLRFVKSEIKLLLDAKLYWRLPEIFLRTAMKYLGFKLGYKEKKIPVFFKRRIGMFNHYWS